MPASSGRKKAGSRRAAARGSKRKRPQAAWWWKVSLIWAWLPLVVALAVFVLDPSALLLLAWSCVAGKFGTLAQVVASTVFLCGAAIVLWAFWPEPTPASRRRNTGSGTRQRRTPPASDTEGAAGGQPRRTSLPQDATMAVPPDLNTQAAAGASETATAVQEPLPATSGAASSAAKRLGSRRGSRAANRGPGQARQANEALATANRRGRSATQAAERGQWLQ
jgi:hypothetical protein